MAEPIEMPFGMWTWMGPRKHVLHGVHIGATWRIRLNRSRAAAMRSDYFDHLLSLLFLSWLWKAVDLAEWLLMLLSRWWLAKTLISWLTVTMFRHRTPRPAITPTVRMYTAVVHKTVHFCSGCSIHKICISPSCRLINKQTEESCVLPRIWLLLSINV